MNNLRKVVYLTDEQYRELKANGTITVGDKTIEYSDNDLYITPAVGGYPVKSIYLSVDEVEPAELFGGTWEQIKDCFLLASGDIYSLGAIGGSADAVIVEHSHDVTTIMAGDSGVTGDGYTLQRGYMGNSSNVADPGNSALKDNYKLSNTGEDGTGKNMPPYLTVNVWKRVA